MNTYTVHLCLLTTEMKSLSTTSTFIIFMIATSITQAGV